MRLEDMSERQANPYHQIITRPDQHLVELLGKPCDYLMMRITVLTYTIIRELLSFCSHVSFTYNRHTQYLHY